MRHNANNVNLDSNFSSTKKTLCIGRVTTCEYFQRRLRYFCRCPLKIFIFCSCYVEKLSQFWQNHSNSVKPVKCLRLSVFFLEMCPVTLLMSYINDCSFPLLTYWPINIWNVCIIILSTYSHEVSAVKWAAWNQISID